MSGDDYVSSKQYLNGIESTCRDDAFQISCFVSVNIMRFCISIWFLLFFLLLFHRHLLFLRRPKNLTASCFPSISLLWNRYSMELTTNVVDNPITLWSSL